MSTTEQVRPSGTEIMAQFVPASPFVRHLGIRVLELADGQARLALPFRDELATIGKVVHGGALAALVDTAVMAAAWSGAPAPGQLRGATVDLSVAYLAPADGEDVVATARVLRRGRRLAGVAADVHTAGGTHVAHAAGTYQIG